VAAALADHPFMSSIPIESLGPLGSNVQLQGYAAGSRIFAEGEAADRAGDVYNEDQLRGSLYPRRSSGPLLPLGVANVI
jgi:hypothetical protein